MDCIYASTRLDMIKRNDTLVVAERLMCDVAGFAGCDCGSASKIWRQSSNPLFFDFRGSPHSLYQVAGLLAGTALRGHRWQAGGDDTGMLILLSCSGWLVMQSNNSYRTWICYALR